MFRFYYSLLTFGFYDMAAFKYILPDDAIGLSQDQYTDLYEGQASGKKIVSDGNGGLMLVSGQ